MRAGGFDHARGLQGLDGDVRAGVQLGRRERRRDVVDVNDDELVHARAHATRDALQLGEAAVHRGLATLEPGARASAGARLLAAHAVATRAALARAVAATLARLLLARALQRGQVVQAQALLVRRADDEGRRRARRRRRRRAHARAGERGARRREVLRASMSTMSRDREAVRQVSVWVERSNEREGRTDREERKHFALFFPTLFEDNVRRDVARGAWDARAASARREDVGGTPPGPMSPMASRESKGSVLAHRARPRRRRVPVAGRRRRGPPRTKDPNPQRVRLDAGCAGNARAGTRASRETARTVVETPMDAMVKDAIVSFT